MHTRIQNRPEDVTIGCTNGRCTPHTGALARQLWDGKSRIVVHLVVAKILLSKREKAVKDAVRDVCAQFDREQVHVVPHIWDSNSSADCRWSTMDRGNPRKS